MKPEPDSREMQTGRSQRLKLFTGFALVLALLASSVAPVEAGPGGRSYVRRSSWTRTYFRSIQSYDYDNAESSVSPLTCNQSHRVGVTASASASGTVSGLVLSASTTLTVGLNYSNTLSASIQVPARRCGQIRFGVK